MRGSGEVGSLLGFGYLNPMFTFVLSPELVSFKDASHLVESIVVGILARRVYQPTFIPLQISVHRKASQHEATQDNCIFC